MRWGQQLVWRSSGSQPQDDKCGLQSTQVCFQLGMRYTEVSAAGVGCPWPAGGIDMEQHACIHSKVSGAGMCSVHQLVDSVRGPSLPADAGSQPCWDHGAPGAQM